MEIKTIRMVTLAGLLVVGVGVVIAAAGLTPISDNSGGTIVIAGNGPGVTLVGDGDVYSTSGGGVDANTIRWNTTDGNASFSSVGRTNVTVDRTELTGTWTVATSIDSNGNYLMITPADKPSVAVGGGINRIEFRSSTAADDGTTDFVYEASGSVANVTLRTAAANTDLRAIDKDTGAYLDAAASDGSGHVTFDSLDTGSHTVILQSGNAAPVLSNPQPEGNLSSATTSLSIDVNDSDFGSTGDTVDVKFYLDTSSVRTDTLTSNGTASVSIGQPSAGTHDVRAVATDDVGATTEETWTFGVPDELRIYNETSPNSLVDSPTEVSVEFYASNGSVYERSTTNGMIDFSGLPPDEEFVVSASADGYRDRRIYIESLVEQQRIYLLHENATVANVVFSLQDDSGQFTPAEESILYIEKPLNISGTTKYQVIVSDQFSATREVATKLEDGQRYRLRLKGPEGVTRVLGAYRAAGDDAAMLNVGVVKFQGGSAENPAFQGTLQEVDGQKVIRIVYADPANATDELALKVVNRTSGNALRPETTETGPFGRYVETIPVSDSVEGHSFNVTYEASRSSGYEDQTGTVFVGDLPGILSDLGLDLNILSMLGYLTILGVLGLTAISFPRYAGIPTVAVASALTTLGAVAIPPLLLGGAGVIALMFAVGGEGVR